MKLPPNLGEVLARVQGERRNTLQHSISVLPRTWLTSWQGSIRKTAATSSTSVFSKRWAGVNLLPFSFPLPWRLFSANFVHTARTFQSLLVMRMALERAAYARISSHPFIISHSPVAFTSCAIGAWSEYSQLGSWLSHCAMNRDLGKAIRRQITVSPLPVGMV